MEQAGEFIYVLHFFYHLMKDPVMPVSSMQYVAGFIFSLYLLSRLPEKELERFTFFQEEAIKFTFLLPFLFDYDLLLRSCFLHCLIVFLLYHSLYFLQFHFVNAVCLISSI
jgi:hypothetical protein